MLKTPFGHPTDFILSGKPNASSDRFDWSSKRDRRLIKWVSLESIEIVMAPLKAEPDRCGGSLRRDR